MTCSFHKYGEYFPGTGELRDIGVGKGKHYAVNFPLRDGITDETYASVFEPTISAIMEFYRPGAVVLQCGADSLSGDRLGCFNLSMKGQQTPVVVAKCLLSNTDKVTQLAYPMSRNSICQLSFWEVAVIQ